MLTNQSVMGGALRTQILWWISVMKTMCIVVQGLALLHWACDRGHEAMVHVLLDSGADINVRVSVHTVLQNYVNY